MRSVANKTVFGCGWMGPLCLHPCLKDLMTTLTEIRTPGQEKIAQLRLVGVVAFRAFPFYDGEVIALAGFQFLVQLNMAGKTKRPLHFHNHPFKVTRVTVVTGQAYSVDERDVVGACGFSLHEFTVALGTQFGTGFFQEVLLIRTMGIVAAITLGLGNWLVNVSLREFDLGIGVTRITDTVHSVIQDVPEIRSMRVMTSVALLFDERGMRIFIS
jgi:hypothetical protein